MVFLLWKYNKDKWNKLLKKFFWEICVNNGDGGQGDTCLIDADQLWTWKLSQLVCSHIQNLAFIVVALNVQWKLMYLFEHTKTKWLNSVQTQWWHCAWGYFAFGKTMQFLHNFPHSKILKLYLQQWILARKSNFTVYHYNYYSIMIERYWQGFASTSQRRYALWFK